MRTSVEGGVRRVSLYGICTGVELLTRGSTWTRVALNVVLVIRESDDTVADRLTLFLKFLRFSLRFGM